MSALRESQAQPSSGGGSTPDVTREDQRRINAFGRLNNRKQDVQAELAGKKKTLEDLEEASNELLVTDEAAVRYLTGECFATFTPDEAETRLQADAKAAGTDVERLSSELATITGEMAALKKVLYARFGNNINLEDE